MFGKGNGGGGGKGKGGGAAASDPEKAAAFQARKAAKKLRKKANQEAKRSAAAQASAQAASAPGGGKGGKDGKKGKSLPRHEQECFMHTRDRTGCTDAAACPQGRAHWPCPKCHKVHGWAKPCPA